MDRYRQEPCCPNYCGESLREGAKESLHQSVHSTAALSSPVSHGGLQGNLLKVPCVPKSSIVLNRLIAVIRIKYKTNDCQKNTVTVVVLPHIGGQCNAFLCRWTVGEKTGLTVVARRKISPYVGGQKDERVYRWDKRI